MTGSFNRRTFLKGAGTVAAAGLVAGCGGDSSNGDDNGSPSEDGNGGGSLIEATADVDAHLSGANNYDGQMLDATGQSEVTVDVGAGDSKLAFAPAAVKVSSGTTVTWEWTGEGGPHNVVSSGESAFELDSGTAQAQRDPFSKTFDSTGTALYHCTPHQASGMLGAVVVVE